MSTIPCTVSFAIFFLHECETIIVILFLLVKETYLCTFDNSESTRLFILYIRLVSTKLNQCTLVLKCLGSVRLHLFDQTSEILLK